MSALVAADELCVMVAAVEVEAVDAGFADQHGFATKHGREKVLDQAVRGQAREPGVDACAAPSKLETMLYLSLIHI